MTRRAPRSKIKLDMLRRRPSNYNIPKKRSPRSKLLLNPTPINDRIFQVYKVSSVEIPKIKTDAFPVGFSKGILEGIKLCKDDDVKDEFEDNINFLYQQKVEEFRRKRRHLLEKKDELERITHKLEAVGLDIRDDSKIIELIRILGNNEDSFIVGLLTGAKIGVNLCGFTKFFKRKIYEREANTTLREYFSKLIE